MVWLYKPGWSQIHGLWTRQLMRTPQTQSSTAVLPVSSPCALTDENSSFSPCPNFHPKYVVGRNNPRFQKHARNCLGLCEDFRRSKTVLNHVQKPHKGQKSRPGTPMDLHSRYAHIDKPRFYIPAGQSQGGLVGQNKILKLPPLGNTLCCFYVCSFFIMALERIPQPPPITSSSALD